MYIIRLYIPLLTKIRPSKRELHDKNATIALLPVGLLLGDHRNVHAIFYTGCRVKHGSLFQGFQGP